MSLEPTYLNCKVHGTQSIDQYRIELRSSGLYYRCIKCKREISTRYRINHREKCRVGYKVHNRALRLEVLRGYSPQLCCTICGESHYEFLALDHINGGGCMDRASRTSKSRHKFLSDLKRQGFPEGFRVLCHNCNLKHGCRSYYRGSGRRKPDSELSQVGRSNYQREWANKNQDKIVSYRRSYNHRLKAMVLGHYGGNCACCGIDDLDVLSIDHINGGGTSHRKEVPGQRLGYHWFKKHGYPEGFRVLCMNCNLAMGLYGYCPHLGYSSPCHAGLSSCLPGV